MTFDATSREYCTVRRVRTNTPLQALALLNDEAFFEAAQGLAPRLLTDRAAGSTPESRAAFGFRLVTARQPDADRARAPRRSSTPPSSRTTARIPTTPALSQRAAPRRTAAATRTPARARIHRRLRSRANARQRQREPQRQPQHRLDAGDASGPTPASSDARSGIDAAEQAAWTIVANVLFNLDETVTKE